MRRYFNFAGRTRTLLATFTATLAFLFLVFPNLPINGEMLDMMPGYSHAEALAAMEGYGPDGRSVYAWGSTILDTLFPLAYVTFFAGLIHRFRLTEGTWWLAYLPVAAGVLDLMENVQVTAMLIRYPDIGATQVAWASFFTQTKGYIGPVYQLLGAGLLVIAAVRRIIQRFKG